MRSLAFDSFSSANGFDEIIDVRSPSEYQDDNVPGSINVPVLDDAERAIVGTLHNNAGEFEARKRGAALISANIARHLETHFADKPKTYRALVYCWRGGQRSKSLATVLSAVGWHASLVAGGYKSYRAFVRKELEKQSNLLQQPVILGGLTGSGKTLLLRRMQELGSPQVLDLEGLANHRGSLLGDEVRMDDARQPSQKRFESRLLYALHSLNLSKPVFIESESKRIGSVSCPEPLWQRMISASVALVKVPLDERARFLVDDYHHFVQDPDRLIDKLPVLKKLHGAKQIEQWAEMVRDKSWLLLARSLLAVHYDPSYRRCNNYSAPATEVAIPVINQVHVGAAIAQLAAFATSLPNVSSQQESLPPDLVPRPPR